MIFKTGKATKQEESFIVLTDQNKISHGIEFLHETNTELNARNCREIADETEVYPVDPSNPANPRGEPAQPVPPVLLPPTNINNREQNKISMDSYRMDRQFWQFTIPSLKDDRKSFRDRHAEGFKFLISRIGKGLQKKRRTAIDHNNLRELYQAVER